MKYRIKSAVCAVLILAGGTVFAATFSGFSGLKGDITPNPDYETFKPEMRLSAFFSGQLDFSPSFLIRTELSIQSGDIIETKLFQETDATFCIDELSATYIKPFLGITQYFSFFLGNFEPIGSDVFLQRQFGIKPITSMLTESWLGLRGSTVFPFYGVGGSYIVHINSRPIATGASVYINTSNSKKINQLNMDLRFASVLPYFTVDVAAGFGAPLGSKNGTEDVILLIDELYLHAGIDLLAGSKYSASVFVQAGFENLPLKPGAEKTSIDSNEIYLLVEPRLYTKLFQTHLTFFSLPERSVEKLSFIEKTHTLGLNLSIFTDKLYIKNKDYTFGINTTLSFADKDFFDLKSPLTLFKEEFAVKVSPFVSMPVMGGELKCMFQTKVNGFKDGNWQDCLALNIGYKAQL